MAKQSDNLADQVVQRVVDRAGSLAQQIASTIGTPVDTSKLSREEITRLWNLPGQNVDPVQVQQMIAQGQHAQALDMAYPWRNQLIGKGAPQDRVDRATKFSQWAMQAVSS
jgi:hypothetical protein